MATINAGRVRPYYRGAWASGTTYSYVAVGKGQVSA